MNRIVALALLIAVPLMQAASSDDRIAYEKALALEEASGRLNEAITLFQKVVRSSSDETLAAQAQLHVGICYEKLARREARAAYQAVVEKYPAQREVVRAARDRLARLAAASRPARGTTVREFARGSAPSVGKISEPVEDAGEFVVSSDGQTFVYTDWSTGDLIIKNAATGKKQGLYGVDWDRSTEYFELPAISRDQKRIAYANYSSGGDRDFSRVGIDSISGGKRETIWEDPDAGIWTRDWSPDGTKILATLIGRDRSVLLVQVGLGTRKPERLAALGFDTPSRAEYSPDGRFIAYDSNKDGERPLEPEFRFARLPSFSPDGRKIALTVHDRKRQNVVLLVSTETGSVLKTFPFEPSVGAAIFKSGWSPDGRHVYVVVNSNGGRESRLERIDVETGERTTSPFPAPNDGSSARVSPDGRFLTIKRLYPPASPGQKVTAKLLLRSLADGTERELTTELVSFVKWDSDSRHLFYRKGTDPKQLWRMSIETGASELVWKNMANHVLASVSADGRVLAFQKQGGDMRIWVVENFLPAKPAAVTASSR